MNIEQNTHLKLVYSSEKNPLINLHPHELKSTLEQALAVNDLQTMANATNLYTPSFISNTYKPTWLKSTFESNTWKLEFPKSKSMSFSSVTEVIWDNIVLNDGTLLSEPRHSKLLNTFKYWITNIDNPALNSGVLTTLSTTRKNLYSVLRLIHCITYNATTINLSEMHLSLINIDYLLDTLVSVSTIDSYEVPTYLRFKECAPAKLVKASTLYPTTENKVCLLNIFNLDTNTYNQANNFIIENYLIKNSNIIDYSKFKKFIFENNSLPIFRSNSFINNMIHKDYWKKEEFYGLYPSSNSTPNVSHTRNDNEVSATKLINYIKSLKQLSFSAKQQEIQLDHTAFIKLNYSTVARLVDIAENGRFRTLPVTHILKLMRNTFEFSFQNIDSILESVINILEFQTEKGKSAPSLNICSRNNFSNLVNQLYPDKLVCADYAACGSDIERKRISLHSNTLINKYNILISSVQFLFSIFSAKRISEINNLNPHSNLSPDINPDEVSKNTYFSIKSLVMKTGTGGDNDIKAITQRPIIRSIAKLIWKIESFNQKAIKLGVKLPRLFNLLGASENRLNFPDAITISPYTYICDYFETPFINDNGISKKLYFSNHQLRRFFAIMFFWTNGYDGLDTIRWMLGHSTSEHLYHYITESNNGVVLNGIKAAHLVNEVKNGQFETIEKLRKAISQYYDVEQANIELERISDAVQDYIKNEDYETNPSHLSDANINNMEDTIYKLLHNDVIKLEPKFFTIKRKGKTVQDYRMILEVKELF